MTRDELKAYAEKLCKQRGFDAAKTEKVVAKTLKDFDEDPDAGSLIAEAASLPIKHNDDYNSKMDELKTKATALDAWHKNADGTVKLTQKQIADAQAKIAKYEEKYGKLEASTDLGDGTSRTPSGDVIKTADLDKLIQVKADERIQGVMRFQFDAAKLRNQHFTRFKELIDESELLEIVSKAASDPLNPRNITLEDAYNQKYGEKVQQYEDKQKKENDQKLIDLGAKQERERLARQGMRTGAANPDAGLAFAAINSEGKKDDATRALSEDDRLAAFAADIGQEMAKQESRDEA